MLRALVVFLIAILLCPTPTAAEGLPEYQKALTDTLTAAEAAVLALSSDTPLAEYQPLEVSLQRLETIRTVSPNTEQSVSVDNQSLIERFRSTRRGGNQALRSLRQLVQEIDAVGTKTEQPEYQSARKILEEILARPEFRSSGGNPVTNFFEELRARFINWLNNLFPDLSLPDFPNLEGPLGVLYWLVAGATAVFSILFLGFTLRSTRLGLARYSAIQTPNGRGPEHSWDARDSAQRAADDSNYRLAVHFLYLWAILYLAEKAQKRVDRSLTNREQIRSLATGEEVGELLRALVETFDKLWYGQATCTETEYGRFRSSVERIVGAA